MATESEPTALEWESYLGEGPIKLPRKRVTADLVVRDVAGRILLVDPHYKLGWDVPGGMVEVNEAPHAAAAREMREELGLDLVPGRLLVVDWMPPHEPWDDVLAFVFDGGTLTEAEAARIRVVDGEVTAYRFCERVEARKRLLPLVAARIDAALEALRTDTISYLHRGQPVGEFSEPPGGRGAADGCG
ncbi:NUDIX domain-containing protein [Cryptosporangium aurantiacum]|uniref:NUDIX domain-containing protein n=1 Tax=Cryptosporangium aurantiacum TaxID=134849 RepID=UPI001C49FD9E|nr:NUDIX hydrolase [Cryptosporangium aurantiacum]